MCVCVYRLMYVTVYKHICMNIYVGESMYEWVRVCECVCVCVCVYVCVVRVCGWYTHNLQVKVVVQNQFAKIFMS